MQAAGDQKVARAFGRALNQNRSLDVEKPFLVKEIAHEFDYLVAQDQIVPLAGAAQVQVAILEAKSFVHG